MRCFGSHSDFLVVTFMGRNRPLPIMPCYRVWKLKWSVGDSESNSGMPFCLSCLRGFSNLRPASLLGGSNSCPRFGREDAPLRRDGSRRGLWFGPAFHLDGCGWSATGENTLHLLQTSEFRVYLCNDFCRVHCSILRSGLSYLRSANLLIIQS